MISLRQWCSSTTALFASPESKVDEYERLDAEITSIHKYRNVSLLTDGTSIILRSVEKMAITLWSLAILPVVFSAIIICRLFFHPLAKLPGPKLLAISSLPAGITQDVFGRWYQTVAALHQNYGPIFRMGPNEIAVDGNPGWDEVFRFTKQRDFPRDDEFFNRSMEEKVESSIFLTDKAGHNRQRRVLAHAFSQGALYEQEPLIMQYVDLLMTRLSGFATADIAANMVAWFSTFAFRTPWLAAEGSQREGGGGGYWEWCTRRTSLADFLDGSLGEEVFSERARAEWRGWEEDCRVKWSVEI